MGTTLTGTKPKDTYDSLIKVGDNGPIGSTAKVLSDGLGNDLPIAVSTSNVGIGTSSPNFILETAGTTGIGVRSEGVDGVYTDILSSVYSANANEQNAIQTSVSGVAGNSGFRFQVSDGSGLTTQTLGYQLNKDRHVFYTNGSERVRVTTDGLTFNGDTAAANALDDYEEGTWTPAIAFGGASVGLTYVRNSGTYTKVGRKVTVCGDLILSAKGSSTGSVTITGLPFTIGSATNFLPVPSFRFADMAFSGFVQGYGGPATTVINMENVTSGAGSTPLTHADFEDATQLMVTLTYFV